jgi:hypothetical protein
VDSECINTMLSGSRSQPEWTWPQPECNFIYAWTHGASRLRLDMSTKILTALQSDFGIQIAATGSVPVHTRTFSLMGN